MRQTQTPVQIYKQTSPTKNLDELWSEFFHNVGHELNGPITIIWGYAELLSEGRLGALAPEQQKALFAITNRTHELRRLVERVTALLSVKTYIDDAFPLALAEIVEEVMAGQEVKAKEAGINLTFQPVSSVPLIAGRRYPLQLAVECLVENAIKFTPYGGQVEVRLVTEPDWVRLIITDTGIGIAEEELERIFDSFYQVVGSSTRSYGGLGLGLTIVRIAVEAYQGQIEVESQPGRGSRFIVKFPVLPEEAQPDKLLLDKSKKLSEIRYAASTALNGQVIPGMIPA